MKAILADVDKLVESKKPSFKKPAGTSDQFNASLAEIQASREEMSSKERKNDAEGADFEKDLKDKLEKAKTFELYTALKGKLSTMKSTLEEKIKAAEKMKAAEKDSAAAKDSKGKGKGKGEPQEKKEINLEAVLRRLATIQGKKVEDLEGVDVHSETMELKSDVMSYLFTQPYNISRLFEQSHQVMVQGNRTKGSGKGSVPKDLTISGTSAADVGKVAKALKDLDLSTKKSLEMDGRAISNVFGPGGSKAREIEKEFPGLYMAQNKNELILVGPAKQVDAAYSKVEMMASTGAAILAKVTADTDKCKAIMKSLVGIEQATNTKIKVSHLTDNSQLQIRGNTKDEVEASKAKLEKALNDLKSEYLQGTAGGITKLYKSGGSAPEIARKFQEIRNNPDYTILKKGDGLQIISTAANVKKIKGELSDLLVKASFEPLKMKIHREQVRIFSKKETIEAIQSKSGAEVKVLRGGEPSVLILGDEKAKEKAKAEIQELITSEGTVKNVSLDEDVCRQLLVSNGAMIKDLEKKFSVSLSLDKQNHSLSVFGAEKGVESAVEELQTFQGQVSKDAASAISKEVPVASEHMGLVIGQKGSTLRRIREACKVKITVDDENSSVTIKGPENLVAKAEIMIAEAIKADGAEPEKKPEKAPTVRAAKGEGKSKKSVKEYKGSAGDFPSLGAAAPKSKKKPGGAWGKKDADDDEAEEEAEAEEAPAAAEEAEEAEANGEDEEFDPLAMCGGMAEEVVEEKSDWLKASEERRREREAQGIPDEEEKDADEEEEDEEEDK
eukprot:gnl/MRDRNA2_/MRDRNA2_30759_c0_seq1.p1 gnl/MRDRNA2_/MRDRNA2_30759_c0~~gnl/MRDRNA2_/MRDRNA2_30759_c0_seq1.p1  ORF type:complete len:784 (-),score=284.10 gnl/MRDRNA2_/MRDRNA2_30759_c0_seq1:160-2511(-)